MARILIVEDDDDLREAYTARLRDEGHQVSAERTAEAALDALGEDECDLLIVDLMLPGMDGAELSRSVRATGRKAGAFPILMITSMGERMGIRLTPADARWAPVDRYVDKANVLGGLGTIVTELLTAYGAPRVDTNAEAGPDETQINLTPARRA